MKTRRDLQPILNGEIPRLGVTKPKIGTEISQLTKAIRKQIEESKFRLRKLRVTEIHSNGLVELEDGAGNKYEDIPVIDGVNFGLNDSVICINVDGALIVMGKVRDEPRVLSLPGWESIVIDDPITGAKNYAIEPNKFTQIKISIRGSMDSSPAYPLLLLNNGFGASDYRTSGYVEGPSGRTDDWATEDFWRVGQISTAVGIIDCTIYKTDGSGWHRYMIGEAFRNVSDASYRRSFFQGATKATQGPVDRIRITQRISEFGAINELRVTIKGLVNFVG